MKFPSLRRIYAIFLQEHYVHIHSLESIFDIYIFSTISLILFGFLSKYLMGAGGGNSHAQQAGTYLLIGMLFWELVRIAQYTISVDPMWNIWSRNLSNMFISPLRVSEYIIALALTACGHALVLFLGESVIARYVFGVNVFVVPLPYLLFSVCMFLWFSVSIGIFIFGLICKFGTRIQSFGWGIVPMLQPLTAALFPVSSLPVPLQYVSYVMPTTHIFEMIRGSISGVPDTILQSFALNGFILNCVWFTVCILIFRRLYASSHVTGQFARNEG